MPGPAETQARTLDQFMQGWKTFTVESWTATWSPTCKQKLLPFTMGVPARDLDSVYKFLPGILSTLKNYKVEFYHVIHDAVRGKAAIYATSHADTLFGDDFKWTNEYAVFLTFSEDGTQVDMMEEMVDSAFFKEFLPRYEKYAKAQGGA